MKRVTIFGATGSIGQNTLDLIRRNKTHYDVVGLTGAGNIDQLAKDAIEFDVTWAVTADETKFQALKSALSGTNINVAAGPQALLDLAQVPSDWIMSAIVGAAGLAPGLAALAHGTTLALANKETLVAAGGLVKTTAKAHGATLLPVDSEHSAIFQALIGEHIEDVERVIITASGGAFRDWPMEKLATATPTRAATHPNWDMGQRITIDSASMFNKALELIEAKELFGLRERQIETVIHPESLIHALVGFQDGGLMAHVGPPDMRHAIGFALHYPRRDHVPVERLDFTKLSALTFRPADEARYPALRLAREVMNTGGLAGAAFNAAKEIALDRFIAEDIGFLDMAALVEATLQDMQRANELEGDILSLDNVLAADHLARQRAAIRKV
ncbi:MAG: 1-deoxy-D-xylulose-5-phosphate reductoisomerase [Planktomarina sp.]